MVFGGNSRGTQTSCFTSLRLKILRLWAKTHTTSNLRRKNNFYCRGHV